MPVSLHRFQSDASQPCIQDKCGGSTAQFERQATPSLHIGLINNMPDAALEATERQFISLLNGACGDLPVRLSIYSLPGVPRGETAASYIDKNYSSIEDLRHSRLDGLIVTGREPLAADLRNEPYWKSFIEIVEWANHNTRSTIWSCLAAHAAVLYMDGIRRIRSSHKHFGIFKCEPVSSHALTQGAPPNFRLPHSRWNGVPENALVEHRYSILTRTIDGNVDTFVRQQKSLFVFFQGHPEYESNTLLLEYRRDVGRFLREEISTYPLLPRNYFGSNAELALTAWQNRAALQSREMSRLGTELLGEITTVLENAAIENTWRSTAACLYRNWFEYLSTQKELEAVGSSAAVEAVIR